MSESKRREVILKHALPNALNPIITLAGTNLAVIFGGSIVIENVFSFPGIGQYMIGFNAFGSACFKITSRWVSPFERAVTT